MRFFGPRLFVAFFLLTLVPAPTSALIFSTPPPSVETQERKTAALLRKASRRETTRATFVASLVADLFPTEISSDCFARLSPKRYKRLFSDVTIDAPYAPALCVAMRKGIIRGYPDGAFRPDQIINMAETAKVLAKAYGLATEPTDPSIPWYQPSVAALQALHIPLASGSLARGLTPDEAQHFRWTVRCSQVTTWIERQYPDGRPPNSLLNERMR